MIHEQIIIRGMLGKKNDNKAIYKHSVSYVICVSVKAIKEEVLEQIL